MMQIDCEVINTKMMYVKESAIPAHLRQQVLRNSSQPVNMTPMPLQNATKPAELGPVNKAPLRHLRRTPLRNGQRP